MDLKATLEKVGRETTGVGPVVKMVQEKLQKVADLQGLGKLDFSTTVRGDGGQVALR